MLLVKKSSPGASNGRHVGWALLSCGLTMRTKAIILAVMLLAVASAAALLAACAAELPGAQVCSPSYGCPDKQLCVLGRCRNPAKVPVSDDATRLIFEPVEAAWIGPGLASASGLPDMLVFGNADEGRRKLLLRFALKLPKKTRLQRALLVLEPVTHCGRRPGRLQLAVAQILSPWSASSASWSRQPEQSLAMIAAESNVVPARAIRLDVTELVQQWADYRHRYHGIALVGRGTSPSGGCYGSGVTRGPGPRLELYVLPQKVRPKKRPKADAGSVDGGPDGAAKTGAAKPDGATPKSTKDGDDD